MISLYDLFDASSGQLYGAPVAQIFEDFCIDADKAAPNQMFVVTRTRRGDTHQYIRQAIRRGVTGVLCERPPDCETDGISVLMVQDCAAALMAWSHFVLGKYGVKVIGVAGSAGKSISATAIARVLQTRYPTHFNLRTGAGMLSVPLALTRLNASHRFVVLRLSTPQPGEMAAMIEAIQPEVGVLMNVGSHYTDWFDTSEQFAEEIGLLINYLSPSGLAVLNYDDDLVRAMSDKTRAEVKTFGMSSFGADMTALNVTVDPDGTRFDLRMGSERHVDQHIPLFGPYHLNSVMAALSIGLHYGIPIETGLSVLKQLRPLAGRMNLLAGKGGSSLVDDTYGANPQSTLAALDWLQAIKDRYRRVFFIFGDMQFLGPKSKIGHRHVGQHVAEVVDVLITRGTEAAITARAALDHGMDPSHVHVTYATQDTIAALVNGYDLTASDLVLLKGGPDSRMEQVTQALLHDPDDQNQLVRTHLVWDAITIDQPSRLSWVEIDTEALASNVRMLKSVVGDDVTLMAVVKSDAYGHGAAVAARTALLNGAGYLGVSSLQEALELRENGITAPILVMNYTPPYMARQAIQHNITLTLYDLAIARDYDRIGRERGAPIRVHVKLDTGMGRMGPLPEDTMELFRHLIGMQHIAIEGIFTHFAAADEDPNFTNEQLAVFRNVLHPIQATTGFKFKYIHAANSAATLAYPRSHFNMVRTGLAMYGLHPSEQVRLPDGFRPVMTWKTVIAQTKTLPAGHTVGYGRTYTTSDSERIAILPVGYADGFRRAPNNWGEVLVRGQRAPLIGRVSMEKSAIRIDHIPDASVGDEVVLLGTQGRETITAEEIAARLGTINYEIACTILPRVPR